MAKSTARGVGVYRIRRGVMISTWLLALQGCVGVDVTAPEPRLVWSRVPSGTADDLWDVWGSSATDVWAVGSNGSIVHYDGTRWARSLDSVSYFFRGVWGSGPTDIWAVGFRSLNNTTPVIFHYDGTGWARDATVPDTLPWPPLSDVWGTSASNVWVVGYGGWISHFDGSRWTYASVGPAVSSDRIWGTSATDAWTVGPQTVMHHDGVGWYAQSDSVLTARQLSAGWGARYDDQWAAGSAERGFLHFDGSGWSPVVPEDAASGFISGMWGVTPSRIWAVSRTGTGGPGVGAIWQYNGTQWFIVARDTINFTGVWASSASDAWVVGDFGAVLHGMLAH